MFAFHSIFFMSFAFINLKNVTLCKLDELFHTCSQCRGRDILQELKKKKIIIKQRSLVFSLVSWLLLLVVVFLFFYCFSQ